MLLIIYIKYVSTPDDGDSVAETLIECVKNKRFVSTSNVFIKYKNYFFPKINVPYIIMSNVYIYM